LLIRRSGNLLKIVSGIKVIDKQAVRLPVIRLTGPAAPDSADRSIGGKILQPNGNPLKNGSITLYLNAGGIQHGIVKNGLFRFHLHPSAKMHRPRLLTVRAPGYTPLAIRIDTLQKNLSNLQFKLRKPEFGKLKISVAGPSGNPLSGALASVRPAFNPIREWAERRKFSQKPPPAIVKTRATNEKGVVVLEGLACGRRRIDLSLNGYYAEGRPQALIQPNRTTQISITLIKGDTLKGRVRTPVGFSRGKALIYLLRDSWRGTLMKTAAVDSKGKFIIAGLPPGPVTILALYPGLRTKRPVRLIISRQENIPMVDLELVRPETMILKLGKLFSKGRIELLESMQWHPVWHDRSPASSRVYKKAKLDATGHAEISGLAPGSYDLLINRSPPKARTGMGITVQAARLIKDLQIQSSTPSTNLRNTFKDLLDTGKPENGCVTGRIRFRNNTKIPLGTIEARLRLTLVSSKAVGAISIDAKNDWREFGTGATENAFNALTPAIHAANTFTFTDLPAGEYKLFAQIEMGSPHSRYALGLPQMVRRFSLNRDEMLSIGEVVLKPTQAISEFLKNEFEARWGTGTASGSDRAEELIK